MEYNKSECDRQHRTRANTIIGNPLLAEKSISFKENSFGNILFCEEGTDLRNCTISFNGDNALVYLSKNKHVYRLNVSINRDSVLFIGKDNYFNGKLNLILSERRHIAIGDNGLFSFGIWLRTADPHLIYDCDTRTRINPSKDILIGDHVWIGQGSLVLKGSIVASGSIVGANSTVSGKQIPSNQSWAGAPAKKIAENIFFDGACVHNWTQEQTNASQQYDSDKWTFNSTLNTNSDISSLFKQLDSCESAQDKIDYIESNPSELQGKYRFAMNGQTTRSQSSDRPRKNALLSKLLRL